MSEAKHQGGLLAEDLKGYDASVDADSVAEAVSGWIVEIVQTAAGLVPQNALQKQQQMQIASDLKIRYGDYSSWRDRRLLSPFPDAADS